MLAVAAAIAWISAPAAAQAPASAPPPPPAVTVPGFWDPKRRHERPELPANMVIRFLTETNYPPFNYAGPNGSLMGFNVDLARMLCEELAVSCTVQARRFDTIVDALADNRGDAAAASIAPTPETRRRLDFTDPYYRSPGRFVGRRDSPARETIPEQMEGVKVGVVAGSAHEAYLRAFFTGVDLRTYPSDEAVRQALRAGEVELLFGDGIQLAFWLNGSDSNACCEFRGGPFTESRYFGEGIGIAVRRENDIVRQALNWALFRVWEKGRYTDLWLRYFPISPF